MQMTSTRRIAWNKSPMRPASGEVRSRTAVPVPSTSPSCSGGTPRALTKAGRNGEATPNAAYIAAYSSKKRVRVVGRRELPMAIPQTRLLLGTFEAERHSTTRADAAIDIHRIHIEKSLRHRDRTACGSYRVFTLIGKKGSAGRSPLATLECDQ